jgi:hypothetical protein
MDTPLSRAGTDGRLRQRLERAWSAATTSDPENWTPANPAWGQCAVTACAVQDEIGGDVVWAEAQLPDGRRVSHYFNSVDGDEIDMTRAQFPVGTIITPGAPKAKNFATTRDYVLSFPATRARYERLKRDMG